MHDISDEELVRRFRAGHAGAFEAIVARYQDRVFRLASVWLWDEQLAADAAQEVFLRSYKGLAGFRFRSRPYTWIYRMTRNVCSEFNRKQRPQGLDREPGDSSRVPEREVLREDAVGRVRALVAALPERQRDVVVLRVFEGMSVAETAQTMGCRQGTVKALLHQAMAKLKLTIETAGIEP